MTPLQLTLFLSTCLLSLIVASNDPHPHSPTHSHTHSHTHTYTHTQAYSFYQQGIHYQYTIGDDTSALISYQQADQILSLEDDDTLLPYYYGMYNDMGVLYTTMGQVTHAQNAFEQVLKHDPYHINTISNFAHLKSLMGDLTGAQELYERGSKVPNISREFLHNYGVMLLNSGNKESSGIIFHQILNQYPNFYPSRKEIAIQLCKQDNMENSYHEFETAMTHAAKANDLNYFWQIYFEYVSATPMIFPTLSNMESFRNFYLYNLYEANLLTPPNSIVRPQENMGCSYLGYYLIYQGYVDIVPRQLYSNLLMRVSGATIRPPGLQTNFYERENAVKSVTHRPGRGAGRLVSVGFLGNFCQYGSEDHSVTLLTKGVITHLNRSEFSVKLISTARSMTEDECKKSNDFVEEIVVLPNFSLNPAEAIQMILDMSLDILVFTEVGMNHDIYFLAHSRLALRTVSFWGHAITSGIVDFDSNFDDKDKDEDVRGGPDYFVSSVLFEKCQQLCSSEKTCTARENKECFGDAQKKYSERLLLQEGLTTYFYHPPLPLTWDEIGDVMPSPIVTDETSEHRFPMLPDKFPFLAQFLSFSGSESFESSMDILRGIFEKHSISEGSFRLYCIPQTLYKLSPGNIDIIKKLLITDTTGILVLLDGEGGLNHQKQLIMNEFPSESLERIVFLRKLSQRQYVTLLAVSDVVLDTFPVGGGRSSLAILSTGTPIVILYPATSILQLTYGMYQVMGVNCSLCITYDDASYVSSSIEIASNKKLQASLRRDILENKNCLFENSTVIKEWERMLKYILDIPRPLPFSGVLAATSHDVHELQSPRDKTFAVNDALNYVDDLKRIHSQSGSDYSFEDWMQGQPVNLSKALRHPYKDGAIRLSSVVTSIGDSIVKKQHERKAESSKRSKGEFNRRRRNRSDYNLEANYDEEVLSLGIILDGESRTQLTPDEKVNAFNRSIVSLKVALGVESTCEFPCGAVKEVLVVDDGTVGMTMHDRVLFASSFPNFHFIFERTQSSTVTRRKKHWLKLRGLSSLIKLAQNRYLLLFPSTYIATASPRIPASLDQAFQMQTSLQTGFGFMMRFSLQLLNGYTNVTSYSNHRNRFGVKLDGMNPPDVNARHQKLRQASHIVLLNSLFMEGSSDTKSINFDELHSDVECAGVEFDKIHQMLNGKAHLLVGQCGLGTTVRQKACACGVARDSYLKHPTYFGGFVDEDIRSLCDLHRHRLHDVESAVLDKYRDFTCLISLFDSDVRNRLNLASSETQYLRKVEEMYLQPSLWDIDAVSYVVQGLENEFLIEDEVSSENKTIKSTFRHDPRHADVSKSSEEGRRSISLVQRRNLAMDLFHARAGVVFDEFDSIEQKNDPMDYSVCNYMNMTTLAEKTSDIFQWCGETGANKKKPLSRKSSIGQFIRRLLSADVSITYLDTNLFGQ